MEQARIDISRLIERLHRRYLDVVRAELDRLGYRDLTPVQAVLLANIGDDEIVMRELIDRGYYQGSNVSYNVKKLTEGGYLEQARVTHDRRSVRIRLTKKSKAICQRIREMQALDAETVATAGIADSELERACETLRKIERVWSDLVRYR